MVKTKLKSKVQLESYPLLKRIVIFLVIFIIYSSLIGPHIVSSASLYRDHFNVYGGIGKALLFAILAFALISRRRKAVVLGGWHKGNLIWLALSVLAYASCWIVVNKLIRGNHSFHEQITAHVLLISSIIFSIAAVFGSSNIRKILAYYRRDFLYSAVLGTAFYVFLLVVYGAWTFLAEIVLHSVYWLLRISGLKVAIIPPRTLLLDKFGITVAQYCSGIESIALFSGLYTLVGLLDRTKINVNKFIFVFFPALILLFGFNILRVYVLVLAGYYINPQIAFSLFHTYAGMVLFIIYSGLFWAMSYKWMLKDNNL